MFCLPKKFSTMDSKIFDLKKIAMDQNDSQGKINPLSQMFIINIYPICTDAFELVLSQFYHMRSAVSFRFLGF